MENFEQFHCYAQRLLQAPTIAITRLLQKELVLWLSEVGEALASKWFNVRRTRPTCFSHLTSRPVIIRTTSSHGRRRSSAKTQRFCSADIISRVSVVAMCIFAAVPSLPPCASGPNISLRANPPPPAISYCCQFIYHYLYFLQQHIGVSH